MLKEYFTYVGALLSHKEKFMRPREYDHRRYQRNKTRKKLSQRRFEEMKETSTKYEPNLVKVGDRKLTPLEAKDNMEMRFRAEMFNRSSAISQIVSKKDWDYSRLTITFATDNRVENNFYGYEESADNYLCIQNNSIRHFIESVVRKYKRATKQELLYKYNMEIQLLNGTNMHAHVIFYHERDTKNSLMLSEIIMELRYSIRNKKIKKKGKDIRIISVGRLYLQVSSYHKEEMKYRLSLDSESEVYSKLNMIKDVDKSADNFASVASNLVPYKNYITGSWVWFSFLPAEKMAELHAMHDQYDNKAFLAHTPAELMKQLEHDTKAVMQNGVNADKELTADFIVEHIKNDWCKNYVNNAILEDLNIRRVTMSENLLFPISIYRKCRPQLIDYDDRHEEIYFTTMQLENGEIEIERNSLYTKVVDIETGDTMAQFNTKPKSKKEVYDVAA